jgi:5'-3' exoribonuclease 1
MLTVAHTDLRGIEKLNFSFDLGKPFRPFEQLMGVLPAASQGLIPPAYRVSGTVLSSCVFIFIMDQSLMDNPDSPILDFYPVEFEQDMNGKKQEWEAIVKIPFIDEKRLLGAMSSEYSPRLIS